MGSHIPEADHKLFTQLRPLPPKCWDCKPELPCWPPKKLDDGFLPHCHFFVNPLPSCHIDINCCPTTALLREFTLLATKLEKRSLPQGRCNREDWEMWARGGKVIFPRRALRDFSGSDDTVLTMPRCQGCLSFLWLLCHPSTLRWFSFIRCWGWTQDLTYARQTSLPLNCILGTRRTVPSVPKATLQHSLLS